MDLTESNTSAIPFGAANWPLGRLAQLRHAAIPGLPLAQHRPGQMLRLNDDALHLPVPPPGDAETAMQQRIETHLKRLYGGWNKAADVFIERYFAFLQSRIEQHRVELEERLAPFEGLFAVQDYLYSAPLPLPHAHLFAPDEPAPARAAKPADFVKADFAFCLETRIVAVLFTPSPLMPMAARRQNERLANAGIEVAACKAADLADDFAWFVRLFGPEAQRFWEGVTLPAAPPPPGLPAF